MKYENISHIIHYLYVSKVVLNITFNYILIYIYCYLLITC